MAKRRRKPKAVFTQGWDAAALDWGARRPADPGVTDVRSLAPPDLSPAADVWWLEGYFAFLERPDDDGETTKSRS